MRMEQFSFGGLIGFPLRVTKRRNSRLKNASARVWSNTPACLAVRGGIRV